MKKQLFLMGLMCIALSITSCSKDDTEGTVTPKGEKFELFAAPQTRTAADGMNTKWVENDDLNVFHAPAGTTTYGNNDQFKIAAADLETGRFTGIITDATFDQATAYDWYVIYPYNSFMQTPANDAGAYFYFGSRSDQPQTQTGVSNLDHICGPNIPLYGKVLNVTGSPTFQMHHITTLFKVAVTNTGNVDMDVTKVQFSTTSENLIGAWYVNIAEDTPSFAKYQTYQSKTASLTVTNGTIAAGASGDFYLATKPFTVPAGEVLTLSVTANGKAYEKQITLSAKKTFVAGKINTLNYSIAAEPEKPEVPAIWTKVTALSDITEGEYIIVNGDYYLPTTTTGGDTAPAIASLKSAGIVFENDTYTAIAPDVAVWSFTGTTNAMTIQNSGGDYLYGIADNNGIRVGSTTGITWAFEVYNTGFAMKNNVTKSTGVADNRYCAIYATSETAPKDWRSYTKKSATNYKINSGILYLYKKGAATTDPYISSNNIKVGAAAVTDGESSYTIGNTTETAITATCDGTVVSTVIAEDGLIMYESQANYSNTLREGWIELKLTNAPEVTTRITVTQAGSTFTIPATVSIANDATSATFTVVSPEFGWTITAPDGITVSPLTGNAGETEVTVTSTTPNTGTEALPLGSLSILRSGDAAANVQTIAVEKLAAGGAAQEYSVKWTATSGAMDKLTGTISTGSFDWTYTRDNVAYTGWVSNCIQLGKKGSLENLTLSTKNIPGTIKSISVECASYNAAHNITITVGGITYLAKTATPKWTTVSAVEGTGSSSGEIKIEFTEGSRALYIKSVTVVYEN